MQNKVVAYDKMKQIHKASSEKKRVLVGGCYDIIHFGHITFLQAAKQEGDVLVVALESDRFISKTKKREPVHTQEQRAEVLSFFTFVDYIILLPYIDDSAEYVNLVQSVKPHTIAITENDQKVHLKRGHAAHVDATVKVVCPELTNFSTTKIIQYASLFSD